MSTRAVIDFADAEGDVSARIYRHCDGYPDTGHGVLADMERFFKAVEAQTRDTRFGDPSYLAAKFVVWQAGQNANSTGGRNPLNFLSVGIIPPGADYGQEYTYTVTCGAGSQRPKVKHRRD